MRFKGVFDEFKVFCFGGGSCVVAAFGDAFDECLGVGLEPDLGNEFGVDFDEFDELGGTRVVYLLRLEVCLMSLGVRSMTLGVGLEQELGDEFRG